MDKPSPSSGGDGKKEKKGAVAQAVSMACVVRMQTIPGQLESLRARFYDYKQEIMTVSVFNR